MIDNTQPNVVKDEPGMPPTDTESLQEIVPSVKATYEDTFMQQVRSLGPTREIKAPERFHPEECFISESLTAENKEAHSI